MQVGTENFNDLLRRGAGFVHSGPTVCRNESINPEIAVHPVVWVVEDDRVSRLILSHLLSTSGCHTAAVDTAEQALLMAEDGALPRVALIDLDLPGMNGLELIARLRQIDPDIRMVLVTAQDSDSLRHLLRHERIGYMRKPIEFDRLLEAVSDLLQDGEPTEETFPDLYGSRFRRGELMS